MKIFLYTLAVGDFFLGGINLGQYINYGFGISLLSSVICFVCGFIVIQVVKSLNNTNGSTST